jgi:hypothetical protein
MPRLSAKTLIALYLMAAGIACGLETLGDECYGQDTSTDDPGLRRKLLGMWEGWRRSNVDAPYYVRSRARTFRNGALAIDMVSFHKRNRRCVAWGGRSIIYRDNPEMAGREFVICVNPGYAFHIERRSEKSGWNLIKLVPATDEGSYRQYWERAESLRQQRLQVAPLDRSLEELLSDPAIAVHSSPEVQDESEFVIVLQEKQDSSAHGGGTHMRVEKLIVALDKSDYRTIRRCRYRLRSPVYSWGWFEDVGERTSAGQQTVCEGTATDYSISGSVKKVVQYRTESVREAENTEREPPDDEFRLTYYGIPEPEELRWSRPTPWWLYILLAGLALVMLSFGIYAWRRHRRAAFA